MQPILDHVATLVRPAMREYLAAEDALTDALASNDARTIDAARQGVMHAARHAVDLLHHLADFVFKEPSPALSFASLEDVRNAVQTRCVFGRTAKPVTDVRLLRDIAVAFKHHRPDQPGAVDVSSDVVPVDIGWGQAAWGEGKYGGVEQVIIKTNDRRKRALSSVLQNVFDAWMRLLGQPLSPIGHY